jgi:tetratricopeptide (TPR) repeat protein
MNEQSTIELGGYVAEELVGSGGLSVVYRGRQISTGQTVAIKMLRRDAPYGLAPRDYVERFRREARLCANLNHPHIVPLIDAGESAGGELFAVFAYVPGRDLHRILVDGALEPREALHLMIHVIDALSHAHAHGIVHRDVKPANIMATEGGVLRHALLLDFGIGLVSTEWQSEQTNRLTATGGYVGTPAYSSPEQLRGSPVSFASDVYSWALTFLECLTGQRSVNGHSPYEVVHRHLSPDPIPIPAALEGTALGHVLQAATQKKVRDRVLGAEKILAELQLIDPKSLPSKADLVLPNEGPAPSSRAPISRTHSVVSSDGDAAEGWLVPVARNANFVGRDELLRQARASLRGARLFAIVALHGLGGIGKSQLAVEYVHRYGADYRVVAWIRAEQPDTIAADLCALGELLKLPPTGDQRRTLEGVRRWLDTHDRWLLVFDNAPSPSAIREHLPRGRTGNVLVTSRDPMWRELGTSLAVDVLEPDEAASFLLARTGDSDESGARELAEELGRLPLALEEAAAYIEASGKSIGAYRALLRSHRARMLFGDEGAARGALRTTWELSFRAVAEQAQGAADLLKLCSFLAADDIPRSFFRALESAPSSGLYELRDEMKLDSCVAVLRRYSLLSTGSDAIGVHRLVQWATQQRMTPEERAQWAESTLALVESAFPLNAIAGDSSPECARLLPHALAVLEHVRLDVGVAQAAARVYRRTGIYLSARAMHERARSHLEQALALFETAAEPDVDQIAGTRWELGMVLYALGEAPAARGALERALALFSGPRPPAVPGLLPQLLIALAWVLRTLGEFEACASAARRCRDIVVRAVGPHHSLSVMSLALLARAQWSLGRITESVETLEQAIRDLQEVRDALPLICGTWFTIAQMQLDLGGYEEALTSARRGQEIGEKSYGLDHPLVYLNLRVQGSAHLRRGALAEASRDLEGALDRAQRGCHFFHEDLAIARSELATVFRLAGDLAGAREQLAHALDNLGRVCGDGARVEGEARTALAMVLREAGEVADAVREAETAARVLASKFGADHPLRMAALNALGWALRDLGRGAEADEAFTESLRIGDAARLGDCADRADALEGMGVSHADSGDWGRARESFASCLGILAPRVGGEHAAVLRIKRRIQALG